MSVVVVETFVVYIVMIPFQASGSGGLIDRVKDVGVVEITVTLDGGALGTVHTQKN